MCNLQGRKIYFSLDIGSWQIIWKIICSALTYKNTIGGPIIPAIIYIIIGSLEWTHECHFPIITVEWIIMVLEEAVLKAHIPIQKRVKFQGGGTLFLQQNNCYQPQRRETMHLVASVCPSVHPSLCLFVCWFVYLFVWCTYHGVITSTNCSYVCQ